MQIDLFGNGLQSPAQDSSQGSARLVETRGGQTVELIAVLSAPLSDSALETAFPAEKGGAALLDATRLCAETVMQAEERLHALYLRAAKAAEGRHLILRAPVPEGHFGIRTLLEKPDFLSAHLLAALRASPYGRISLLFPFVSTTAEIAAARQLTERAMRLLLERGQIFDELVEYGIELATPAAALLSRALASETDFVAIDADRMASLALAAPSDSPLYPDLLADSATAILRLIEVAVGNAHLSGRRAILCGKLWERHDLLPHLIAMGIDALVVPPSRLADARNRIRALP